MGLWIALGLILLLGLLSQVRLGAAVDYDGGGLQVRLRLGLLRLRVYPLRQRKGRDRKKEAPPAPPQPPSGGAPRGGSLALLREVLPIIAEAAGRLRRRLRVDRLALDVRLAAPDPAAAALSFGGANAALGILVPLLERSLDIRSREIRTAVDFQRKAPSADLHVVLTLTIGQGLALAFHLGRRALPVLLRYRRGQS